MARTNRLLHGSPTRSLGDYENLGGGHGLKAARHRAPTSIIDLVGESGLRGRGGAGFPTGRKWRTVALAGGPVGAPIVVNAAEGEPGTFKDRGLLRHNPYLVLEGAYIAARAMRSDEIIIGVKASFRREIDALHRAIAETRAAGWAEGTRVRLVFGPDEYLFGEETGMLEVIDGRPPFPRIAPPFRRGVAGDHPRHDAHRGTDGRAALVDNVETLASIPGILRHGSAWFRSAGTPQSPGTILCTVTGATARHGVGEFEMGTPLREVLSTVGDGLLPGRDIVAVLSGVSNLALDATQLDTALSYEAMVAAGSGLGSASFIVIDDETPLVSVAAGVAGFLSIESCGQCQRCKGDGLAIARALEAGEVDAAGPLLATVGRGARCALAGQTQRVVGRLLALALERGEDLSGATAPYPIVPLVDIVEGRSVEDLHFLDKRPDWSMATEGPDSALWPVERLTAVEIHPPRTPEPPAPAVASPGAPPAQTSPVDPIRILHRRLRDSMDALQNASPTERAVALAELHSQLVIHGLATEHLVYPLAARLDPLAGPDIAWYPAHHERAVRSLLDRLDPGGPISPRLVDQLCAELHVLIDELEVRVLPLIDAQLADDPEARRTLALDLLAATDSH